jgi:hypothetical protein
MDENECNDEVEYPMAKSHNRWTLLVLGLNWAQEVASTTAETLGQLTIAASQHANQRTYDKRFNTIVKELE